MVPTVREGHGGGTYDVFRNASGKDTTVRHPSFEASDERVERKLGEAQEPRQFEAGAEDVFVKNCADGMERQDYDAQVHQELTGGGRVVRRGDPFEQTHETHP